MGVIHIYRWELGSTDVAESRTEMEAHEGGVHDLALTTLDGNLVAVSGGGDCLVKVWNAATGRLMFKFTGEQPARPATRPVRKRTGGHESP